MDREKDLQYWIDQWEDKENRRGDQEAFWDNRADFFNEKVFSDEGTGSEVVDLLASKGLLTKEMKVLDIGCGPGKHTLPMAKKVQKITALDLSEKMIGHLRENMKTAEIQNIEPVHLDWKDADLENHQWKKAFDLVFASMSPGISDFDTLKKMLEASRKICFLSSFVKRTDEIGDEVSDYIEKKYRVPPKQHEKIYYVFNLLWKMGYTPEVSYMRRSWKDTMTMEEAMSLYRDKMSSLVTLTDEDEEAIRSILEKRSSKGRVHEQTEVTIGLLIWEV